MNGTAWVVELIGAASAVLAIAGVVLNNYRLRTCFVLWWFSNAASGGLHVWAGLWSLAGRDAVFLILAVQGFVLWGRHQRLRREDEKLIAYAERDLPPHLGLSLWIGPAWLYRDTGQANWRAAGAGAGR